MQLFYYKVLEKLMLCVPQDTSLISVTVSGKWLETIMLSFYLKYIPLLRPDNADNYDIPIHYENN